MFMAFNVTNIETSSDGVWQGEDPLQYAFPLLIVQTVIVVITSRIVNFILTPLRQPLVVAEIAGGIVLGPSVLGRNKHFKAWIFPPWSTPILESVASIGLLFFLFLVGLELDLKSLSRRWRKASGIAVAGIFLPFLFGIGLTSLSRKTFKSSAQTAFGPNMMFIGVSLSITAFPVLARILAELKLLTTGVGETAMAAAAINDVIAWVLLALAVAVAGGTNGTALTPLWILLSALGFFVVMFVIIRPWIRKFTLGNAAADGPYIILTLVGVMFSGFMTDMIGIHAIFGAFILGLIIPKSGDFSKKLIMRTEDFVSGLLLPLYFASTGLKTDISKIQGGEAWGLLVVVILTACAGKFLGTFVIALMCTIPVRESLALGVLMNTKGLVELIVLNIGKEKKVLDDEMFAILVLMALFTTFVTTPAVMAIYKPNRNLSPPNKNSSAPQRPEPEPKPKNGLRILVCIRGPLELPSLITLINSYTSTTKVYTMRLVEMTNRTSSIIMAQHTRKDGLPRIGKFGQDEFDGLLAAAFETHNQRGKLRVRQVISVSTLPVMHEDICRVAGKKRAAVIILPFHVQWREEDGEEREVNLGQGWKKVNEKVVANAPCSIALFVNRGLGSGPSDWDDRVRRVCIAFLGGPDSCEALQLGGRMAHNLGMRITVMNFSSTTGPQVEIDPNPSTSQLVSDNPKSDIPRDFKVQIEEQDETTLVKFIQRWNGIVKLVEKKLSNIVKEMVAVAQSREFELIIVGKGRFAGAIAAEVANQQVEHEELGQIGGLLASQHGINTSILVIQNHG